VGEAPQGVKIFNGEILIDLTGASGTFHIEWFRSKTDKKVDSGVIAGGDKRFLKIPVYRWCNSLSLLRADQSRRCRMRIEDLKLKKHADNLRAVATIIWEDCPRPTQELYFETTEEFAHILWCDPHAFLVACIMLAFHFGEERILIEGEICPDLQNGLNTVMNWMRLWWYEPTKNLVEIEGKRRFKFQRPRIPDRAGVFFSGGIDALATLRANRISYTSDHPGSIKDGLLVCGLEIEERSVFGYVLDSMSVLAKDAGIDIIPIDTNIRSLGPETNEDFWGNFWLTEFMGASLSAVAHAFSKRLTEVSISSCHDIPNVIPYSSHPLINPSYSSSSLRIRHEGITLSRFEKTKLVSEWDLALQHLRVCNKTKLYQADLLNCGKCEKCVRTMLALEALGVLQKTGAFPVREVTEDLVKKAVFLSRSNVPLYRELIKPLREAGRQDLVHAIEQKLALFDRPSRSLRALLLQPIIKFDEKRLGGRLRKGKRLISSSGIWAHH